MSRADEIFIRNCRDILDNGIWDTDRPVRPKWDDGQSAHTIKKFGIINRYNLAEEFPILTLRRTYWKSAIDELLWIWQLKSNNVHDLRTRVWDAWADENGSIGKAYGYQLGVKHHYPQGDMDQVDKVLWDLKHKPGEFIHVIADAHIYDRHVPAVEEIIKNEPKPAPKFIIDPTVDDFYKFTRDSFSMEGYEYSDFKGTIPVAV